VESKACYGRHPYSTLRKYVPFFSDSYDLFILHLIAKHHVLDYLEGICNKRHDTWMDFLFLMFKVF
jgi:hypothetical protein